MITKKHSRTRSINYARYEYKWLCHLVLKINLKKNEILEGRKIIHVQIFSQIYFL